MEVAESIPFCIFNNSECIRNSCKYFARDPKDGELWQSRSKPDENLVEDRRIADVNRFSDFAKGTKDPSNYLVAGSFRSFPQDSRLLNKVVGSGKAND
jgi:hypothetical protein